MQQPRDAFEISRNPSVSRWQRSDWDNVKLDVMYKALLAKFSQHDDLKTILLDTGNRMLVEHTSNDRYWGDGGDGHGQNNLGKLLMHVRDVLRLQGHTTSVISDGDETEDECWRGYARESNGNSCKSEENGHSDKGGHIGIGAVVDDDECPDRAHQGEAIQHNSDSVMHVDYLNPDSVRDEICTGVQNSGMPLLVCSAGADKSELMDVGGDQNTDQNTDQHKYDTVFC